MMPKAKSDYQDAEGIAIADQSRPGVYAGRDMKTVPLVLAADQSRELKETVADVEPKAWAEKKAVDRGGGKMRLVGTRATRAGTDPDDRIPDADDKPEGWESLDDVRHAVDVLLAHADRRTPLTPEQRVLADCNEGLAVHFAKQHWRRAKRARFHFADVVAACKLGIEDAAARFDPARGTKFSVYARGFVLNRIKRMHRAEDYNPDRTVRGGVRGKARFLMSEGGEPYLDTGKVPEKLRAAVAEGKLRQGDLDLLLCRTVLKQTQAEIAFRVGCSVRTIREDEREARRAVKRIIEWLW